jgi:SAM-dependent methyltransferase
MSKSPDGQNESESMNDSALRSWVAEWAEKVPQMQHASPDHWRSGADNAVSYPSSAHSALGRIEADSYWFNHRNDLICAVVKRFPPDGPMFDVGGGNGYVSLGLRRVGIAAIVVEPGTQGAATALGRGLPVIEAAFHHLDIPANSLPAAGLFDVLEHIEDDEGALASLYQAIEPGGMLYIAVPARNALWSAEDEFAGHYRRYSLPHLKSIVGEAGFTVEYGTYFFSLLTAPVFFMRSLPSGLGAKSKMDDSAALERQHMTPTGALGAVFRRSFARELATVSVGGVVRNGTSCLIAAHKPGIPT